MIIQELNQAWFYWSLIIVIGLPVAAIALGEVNSRLTHTQFHSYRDSLRFFRNICLPVFCLAVLMHKVIGLDNDVLAVRVVDTFFWILSVNFILAVINNAFFSDENSHSLFARTPNLLLDLLRFFLVLVAAAVVVSVIWGVDLAKLMTALGIGSVVIGLALQDTLGSLFAGIAMVSSGQKRVGDFVSIDGDEGVVENLNWRAVTIRTVNSDTIVIPNSMVSKHTFTVHGRVGGTRTLGLDAWFGYEHPPQQVLNLLEETALATDGVAQDPGPAAEVKAYDDRGIHYWMWFTVSEMLRGNDVRNDVRCNLWYSARRQGIIIPAQNHLLYKTPRHMRVEALLTPRDLAEKVSEVGAIPRSAEQLLPLMKNARKLRYHESELLVEKNAIMRDVYFVLEGIVEAYNPDEHLLRKIAVFESGQAIAFRAMFRSESSSFELKAATDVVVVAISADEFKDYLKTDNVLATELEELIGTLDESSGRHRGRLSAVGGKDYDGGSGESLLREMFRS